MIKKIFLVLGIQLSFAMVAIGYHMTEQRDYWVGRLGNFDEHLPYLLAGAGVGLGVFCILCSLRIALTGLHAGNDEL